MFNKPHRLKTILMVLTALILLVFSVLLISMANYLDISDVLVMKHSEAYDSMNTNDGYSIEAVMTKKWSDIQSHSDNISDVVSVYELDEDFSFASETIHSEKIRDIIIKSSKELEDILGSNNVNGAFIILDVNYKAKNVTQRPGLYIRRGENGNFAALYGNNEIITKLGYDKLDDWSANYVFDINDDFSDSYYDYPAMIKTAAGDYMPADFGYWSDPFKLSENGEEIITYTMPIFRDNEFYGIIGIEIPTKNFFNHAEYISHSTEKSEMITIVNNNAASVITGTILSPEAEELYDVDGAMIMSSTITQKLSDMGRNAYKITTAKSGELYAYTHVLDLYPESSYFSDNRWTFITIVSVDEVTSFSDSIVKVLYTAFTISILLTIVVAIITISILTNPVEKILKTAENIDVTQKVVFDTTKIRETDTLIDIIETMNGKITDDITKMSKIADMISVPTAIFEYNTSDKKVYVSNSIVNILSLNPAIVINSRIEKTEWERIYNNIIKSPSYEGSFHINKGEDNEKWLVINTFENRSSVIGVITDITESIKERQRVEYEREYDAATGIINRYAFFIRTEKLLPRAKNAAIAIWNINNLKHINDTHGYITGDKLLKAITATIQSQSNENDTITARLSGDEFVTLIFGSDTIDSYKQRLYDLNDKIKSITIPALDGSEISIELHVGIATYPNDATTIKDLLKCADYSNFSNKLKEDNSSSNKISEYKK